MPVASSETFTASRIMARGKWESHGHFLINDFHAFVCSVRIFSWQIHDDTCVNLTCVKYLNVQPSDRMSR